MTFSTRIGLGVSAALVSLSLALAPAAFAQDKMGKEDGNEKGLDVPRRHEEGRWHDEEGRR